MVVGAGYANYLVQVDQKKYFAGFDWRNPISTKSVAVPPGWVFTQQINAEEDPVFTFSSDAAGIISVFAMEDAGDLSLEQYQRAWTAAVRPRMYLDVRPSPFVFEGRFGLQIHGVMANNATRRVHVTLIKSGSQIWRMVSIGVSGRDPDSKAMEELSSSATAFPDAKARARACGLVGVSSGIAMALGPGLGGVISTWLGWRWIFLFNLPICVLVAPAVPRFVPESRHDTTKPLDCRGWSC